MADVGDRVEMLSKGGSRQGVVRRVSGTLVTVDWDTGGQTTVIPAPGVMSVIGGRRPAKKATPAKKKAAPTMKKKAAPAKKKAAPANRKAAAKKAVPAKKKKAPAKKAATKKKR